MNTTTPYSFLKDEFALFEIRKHKWLISERAGREIGFATAALDWVKNYGDAWRFYRFSKLFRPEGHMETASAAGHGSAR